MLGDLGKSLRYSIKRFINKVLVDEAAIDEFLKDVQKALIRSDVDVSLVFELTKKVKARVLEKKSFSQKEQIVRILYEELVSLVGGGFKPMEIKGKPYKILLVGLFGSGKCVHPDSYIPLTNGDIMTAKEIFKKYSLNEEKMIDEDAEIIDITNKNLLIPSFNPFNFKIENKRLTHLWRLKGKPLLKVYLDNGNNFNVKVTPEHPFFVLRQGEVIQVRADELNEDDYVAAPREYKHDESNINLLQDLKQLNLDVINNDFNYNGSIKELHEKLSFKRNYCRLTIDLKKGLIPISLLPDDFNQPVLKVKLRYCQKFIHIPKYLNAELAEFIGYVFGDGHLDKKYVEIVSENPEIIERVQYLTKSLFGLKVKPKRDSRTKAMVSMRLVSKTLVEIINKVFGIPIGRKDTSLSVPKQIIKSNTEITRSFIKAYFDCDAHAAENNRGIELISESKLAIKGVQNLLLRSGIISAISSKLILGKEYWRLYLRSRYAKLFADKIGFRVSYKSKRVENFHNIGLRQGCGKQDMIPLGRMLMKTRMALGFSIGEIQNFVNSYGNYERSGLISRESLLKVCRLYKEQANGFIARVLLSINNRENIYNVFGRRLINGSIKQLINYGLIKKNNTSIVITKKGSSLIENLNKSREVINYLEKLACADVCWLRVNKISEVDAPDFVYDFTVEDNHSFIADGIIVHNTTTSGKLALNFKKRGYKTSVLALDTYRAAAVKQLRQVAEQAGVSFMGDEKAKKPEKVVKSFEKDFKSFDVVIGDSAGRDALDKTLVKEVKAINKAFKPDETLLVIPADIGQSARAQAEAFRDALKITGVIITKLDSTAKGGGALTACAVSGAPVKFIGVGEGLKDLELFKPKGFISRLLGMGDLESLLDKARLELDEGKMKEVGKRFMSGQLTLLDLYEQFKAVGKMGSFQKLLSFLPGVGGMNLPMDQLGLQEENIGKFKVIMNSMTEEELTNPKVLNRSRIERVAKGSGTDVKTVRLLIKQYNQMKNVTKKLKGGNLKKMMKQLGIKDVKQLEGMMEGLS